MSIGDAGVIFYDSRNPFEFFHILNELETTDVQEVYGTLIFPEQKKEKYPLVICIHGSLGWRGHHHEHIVNFLESGFAVFRVHSFDARQVTSIVEDQMQVTLATTLTDCFMALKLLTKHPDIDNKNISIAGWSLGGSTALYAAWEPLAEKLAPDGEKFSSHLAFYPGAYIWPEEMRWSKAPILTLIWLPEVGPVLSNTSLRVITIFTGRLDFLDKRAVTESKYEGILPPNPPPISRGVTLISDTSIPKIFDTLSLTLNAP